ncbi:DUF226 domain-containing protein (plasmid) [Borreliella lusitaniae]
MHDMFYIRGIWILLKMSTYINMLNRLEKEVYGFYCKELPNEGIINKWIEINTKIIAICLIKGGVLAKVQVQLSFQHSYLKNIKSF